MITDADLCTLHDFLLFTSNSLFVYETYIRFVYEPTSARALRNTTLETHTMTPAGKGRNAKILLWQPQGTKESNIQISFPTRAEK